MKKKIALSIVGFFGAIIFLILLMPFISYDLTLKRLGPSPYQVDENLTSETNPEFLTILEIGKEVVGCEEFIDKYELKLNDLQTSIDLLKDFLQKNAGPIEKINLELFKNCKMPKPYLDNGDKNYTYFRFALKLIEYRTTYHILTNDFDKAKNDLILVNTISTELFKKSTGFLFNIFAFSNKSGELNNIKLFLSLNHFTLDQKIEVLNINQDRLTSQIIKNVAHFEIDLLQRQYQIINTPPTQDSLTTRASPYQPIITPFFHQANKTAKLYREMANEIITEFELYGRATRPLSLLSDHYFNYFKSLGGNLIGIFTVENTKPFLHLMASKVVGHNTNCDQLFIARMILLHKKKTGELPSSLDDLSLEKKYFIENPTGKPFLYYAPNGILLSNDLVHLDTLTPLTSKELTYEEIKEILSGYSGSNRFILYLK